MTFSTTIRERVSCKWIAILLFTGALSLLYATPARAQSSLGCVADFGGVVDGNVTPVPPSHLDIDGNCVIRNYPASNPFTTNISFFGANPTSWLVIFDNVVFTGNMSCDQSQGNAIWFTNGSVSGLKPDCQNLFVPTEKINKQNPAGQTTASIGVPFTYTLTMPLLFDPLTGTVTNSNGSPNDLQDITVTDDLNATGADMTLLSQRAYWLSTGVAIPHTFSNTGGALTFGGFPTVPAGQQFVIELTVMLNDTPGNVPGKQFINTAKWTFGRIVNGVFVGPLPGQWGITPPMTIAGPNLVLTKSGPATMNPGQPGNFALNVQNTGTSDAWNVGLRDLLPQGTTGGMCNQTPTILSAQVFAADGVTPIPGKGPLNQGTDYVFSYSPAPNCVLNLTMLTAAGTISPAQRLIINYRTQLDANSQNGATLTNVAGAIQWFNVDSTVATRKTYIGSLTDGTPGVMDNQDAHSVTVSSTDPALVLTKSGPATMTIGQSGTFGLDVQNTGQSDAWNVSLLDLLPTGTMGGMCNFTPVILSAQVFAADGVTPVPGKGPLNQGTDYSFNYSGAPSCQLNLTMLTAAATISSTQHLIITYRTQLDVNSQNGATLTNIAGAIQWFNGDSTVTTRKTYTGPVTNGTPGVLDNQDAHTVTAGLSGDPVLVLTKSGPVTMNLGQAGSFALDVQNTGQSDAWNVSLRDLLPTGATGGMCNLTPVILSAQVFAADGVTPVPGKGPLSQGTDYSFNYTGAPTCQLNLTMLTAAATISSTQHLIITYRTQLDVNSQNGATLTNVAGATQWFNADSTVTTRKTYTGPLTNGTPGVLDNQDAHSVTVGVSADPVLVLTKSGPTTMNLGQSGGFALDVQNTGQGDAWNVSLRDLLPTGTTGGMCNLTPVILSAQVFAADGVTPVPGKGPLNQGTDYSFNYTGAPTCQLNLTMLTAAATISATQHLIISYRTHLDANSQNGVTLSNVAGAIQWFNADSTATTRKTYTGPLTNGTPGILDNQDAHSVTVGLSGDPVLVLTKSGPVTMNLGQPGTFALDVQNTGQSDAWNVSVRDLLPTGTTGGMCNLTPVILSAQVFAADGVTPVPGKGPLNQGTDYSFNYTGAPSCQLNLTMLTAAATISATQHLIISYRTQLDANSQNGATLTNIAGAIQWFNGDSTVTTRKTYTGPLTNGTPGVLDNQDAHAVTVGTSADPVLILTKSGPATMNLGQTGNFALDVQNTGQGDAWNVSLRDLLPTGTTGGMCNLTPVILSAQVFAADGVTSVPGKGPLNQGTDYSFSYSVAPNCALNLTMMTAAATISATQHLIITYRTQLDSNSQNGATLTNVAGAIQWFNADSTVTTRKTYTGPLTNGTPGVLDNQDAHSVTVALSGADPALVLTKSGPATMTTGQPGTFGLDVQNTGQSDAWNVSLRDVLPSGTTGGMCNLTPVILSAQVFAADGVSPVTGKGPLNQGTDYSFSYTGAPTCQLNLTMLTAAATISATQHLIISYRTQLDANSQNGATLTNVAGAIQWFNGDSTVTTRKTYTGALTNGTPGILDNQDAHTVTVGLSGDPVLVLTKSGPPTMNLGQTGTFGLDVQNTGQGDAWNVSLRDLLPTGTTGGMCNLAPVILSAQVFAADGVTPVPGKGLLSQGTDYSFNYSGAPNCALNLTMLTAAATISTTQHLIISYRTQLDANSQNGVMLTNVAAAIQWFNGDSTLTTRKTYTGPLTNGTPGVLDNQDAHSVTVGAAGDPVLVLTKSGPATINVGQSGNFALDVQNTGQSDAWNVSLRDLLPTGTTGGMCNLTPVILSAQVFAADGITPVPGKGPLNQGTDYSFSYSGAPTCQLNLMMVTAAATISTTQHLIITYRTQLDANSQNGATLTNVAGAIQWFNGDSTVTTRKTYTGPLTNGTPGVLDNQDAHTVTVGISADPVLVLTKSGPPTMNPGQPGNFALDVQNAGQSDAWNVSLRDVLPTGTTGGMCNLTPVIVSAQVFAADGVTPVTGKGPLNQGTDYSFSYTGASTCQLNLTMLTASATISSAQHLIITYRTQLDANTQNGVTLTNVAGALQWFNADSTVSTRKTYTGPLTNGTPGVQDNQDAHSVVVGGAAQQVSITNQVSVVGGGPAVPGAQLNYLVHVVNAGVVPATNLVITDDLNASQPGQLSYVNLSATMNGSAAGVSFAGSTITVNYAAVNGPLAPGGVVDLSFRATLNPSLAQGTVVTNTGVVTWNTPTQTANASVTIIVGSLPGFALLSGSLWYDANFDGVQDSGEPALAGWSVDLYSNNQLSQTVQTDSNGIYRIIGVAPNAGAGPNVQTGARPRLPGAPTSGLYELRFRAPGAGANTALLGRAESPFTNGLQRISDIVVPPGGNLQGLNLPIHPNGVVYNSVTRAPIAGATLNLLDGRSAPLPAACFDDSAQQGQITLADGYYRFDINFSDPACPSGSDYLIGVTAPAGGNYVASYSQIIPPTAGASTGAFSVPACPGSAADAIASTMFCEAQPSPFAPAASVAPRSAGTTYYVHLRLDGSQIPGSSEIFNNHVPIDPQLLGMITITKTTPVLNVSRGQLVPYTITANNHSGQLLTGVSIVDRFPAGFTYIKGSATLDGVPTEPTFAGLTLTWNNLTLAGTQVRTLKVLFAVGAGVNKGEFVNRAQALNAASGAAMSQEATATVRLVPDPTFDCTDVIGKVFNDKNRNGRQDDDEEGLPGVRVVTPTGLQATTDKYGRYHITCAVVPNDSRGSNFVLKLDDRTLPSGYRMSTDQVQIERATSGKTLQVNFGASIHRVVAIDLMDAAFEPGTTEIRDQWKPRFDILLEELRKAPAVLRLSYIGDTEDGALVKRRVEAIKRQLTEAWSTANSSYPLTIEPEIFWRRGAPPKQPGAFAGKQVTK